MSLLEDYQKNILDKIYFIAERIVAFDDVDEVFEHIVKNAVSLTKAEAATIRLFNIDTGMIEMIKGYNVSKKYISQPPLRIGECISGKVIMDGIPFYTDDITKIMHCKKQCIRKELRDSEGIKSVISVPMRTGEATIGSITVYKRNKSKFIEHDMLLLNIFASQAADSVERAKLIKELSNQVMFDPLTGVLNKKTVIKEVEAKLKLFERHGYPSSIIFIDIDDFKKFNDTHGHLLGDKLLSDFAKLLKNHCRKLDIVGRFGGEEFVIVAPHTDKNGAIKLADKLKIAISKYKFAGRDGNVNVTFSAGISSIPEDGFDITDLLKKADDAMYISKRTGKNCVTAWRNEM